MSGEKVDVKDVIEPEDFETVPVDGTLYGMKIRDGYHLPNGCINFASIKKFKISPDDVIVCSYPKSGTTWTNEISWLIMNDLNFEKSKQTSVFGRCLWFDPGLTPRQIEESKPPRLIKNHLPIKFLPESIFESKAKFIYVVRDPKDTVVSNFHFYKKIKKDRFVGTFEQAAENFLQGKFWYGPWWEHVNTYLGFPNALIIHYEDLIEKPGEQIKKIADYLGKSLTDSQIEKIIEFTRFENFKKKEEDIMGQTAVINDIMDPDITFFRKGVSGDWRNYFSDELAKRFDDELQSKLIDYKIRPK